MADWKEVKTELVGLAHAIDVPITENRIRWYVKMWTPLGPDAVLEGLRKWSMNTKVKRLPLPGEINLNMSGEEVAGAVLMACRHYGYMRPEEARRALGSMWTVVELMGGWSHICSSEMEKGVFIAQCRNLWNQLTSRGEVNARAEFLEQGNQDRKVLDMDRREDQGQRSPYDKQEN